MSWANASINIVLNGMKNFLGNNNNKKNNCKRMQEEHVTKKFARNSKYIMLMFGLISTNENIFYTSI